MGHAGVTQGHRLQKRRTAAGKAPTRQRTVVGYVVRPPSSLVLAHQYTQGSSKAVSSKSRPLSPETSSSRKRTTAYLAAVPIQGRASGLSRPLNLRERARARRLAYDWLLGTGRRPPSRGARPYSLSLLYSCRRGRFDAWELGGRGLCQILSSDWLSRSSTAATRERTLSFPHAQFVRLSLRQVREAAAGVRRVRADSR